MPEKKRMSRLQKAIIIIVAVITGFFAVVMPLSTVTVYETIFSRYFETVEWMRWSEDDFPGLTVEQCTFDGMTGYEYSRDGDEKAVVVMAHGFGGGGHNTYMNVADSFCSAGFAVFAYDVAGNDASSGVVGGLPQGVKALDAALCHIANSDKYKDLPVVLFGHSWGAYSVGAVLPLHSEVRAAVMVSGFNSTADLMYGYAHSVAGIAADISIPYLNLYEKIKYGSYAGLTAADGIKGSQAEVLIIQSTDDTTVPPQYGYDIFKAELDCPNVSFKEYTDRGHNYILFSQESAAARDKLNEEYKLYAQANGGFSAKIKAEFMTENLDKKLCFQLDGELMAEIAGFYSDNIG